MPSELDFLFSRSPTLQLLSKNSAPMVLGFMREAFKDKDNQLVPEDILEGVLARHLETSAGNADDDADTDPFVRAKALLNQWCGESCQYLRKFFSERHKCYVYQLTRHSEKALQWMRDLQSGDRATHATAESRFARIFTGLTDLSQQTKADPKARLRDLLAQRDALDAEIGEIRETGRVKTLTPAQVKDRLLDLERMVDGFLSDFRAIEDHFRESAAEIRDLYLARMRSRGDIVEHALNTDEKLRLSEQGRSYYGFLAMLRSPQTAETIEAVVDDAAALAKAAGLDANIFATLIDRLYNETSAVQASYNRISSTLRRVVEETAAHDSRQIMEWIAEIKQKALQRRGEETPSEVFVEVDAGINWANLLEMEFFEPRTPVSFGKMESATTSNDEDVRRAIRSIGRKFDLALYRRNVREALRGRDQITLPHLLELIPLENGTIDLVGYLAVAAEGRNLVEASATDTIAIPQTNRRVTINRITFHSA